MYIITHRGFDSATKPARTIQDMAKVNSNILTAAVSSQPLASAGSVQMPPSLLQL